MAVTRLLCVHHLGPLKSLKAAHFLPQTSWFSLYAGAAVHWEFSEVLATLMCSSCEALLWAWRADVVEFSTLGNYGTNVQGSSGRGGCLVSMACSLQLNQRGSKMTGAETARDLWDSLWLSILGDAKELSKALLFPTEWRVHSKKQCHPRGFVQKHDWRIWLKNRTFTCFF